MGQEILSDQFTSADYRAFRHRLQQETKELACWEADGKLDDDNWCFGFELEGWITDSNYRPVSRISDLIALAEGSQLVPELAAFNFELNGDPVPLQSDLMHRFRKNLELSWFRAQAAARQLGLHLLMIGVLPTLEPSDLVVENMSPLQRYRALNRQVFAMRGNRALEVDIEGEDRLQMQFQNVMLESAATSMQLHLQLPISRFIRAFNISKMLSAPMVAASANSPGLFGRRLWDESRIPIFEQSIDVGASDLTRRVTFGIRYLEERVSEAYEANLKRYPVMLPELLNNHLDQLPHLQLHNGTIWRWNRPLLGFSRGVPHLRIEHRVMPSGPSIGDTLGNAALYFGSVMALLDQPKLEQRLPFEVSRDNFYRAAQHSLDSRLIWFDGREVHASDLILELCDLAERGFEAFGVADAAEHLQQVRARVSRGENGCRLQARLQQRMGSVGGMLAEYELQQEG